MTKKEAIYILRNAAWLGSDADRQKVEEAVEVVAKAIEAQDTILYMNLPEVSVEEAIEILKRNSRLELILSDKDINVPSKDCIDRAEAQTAIQFAARRYTVAHEAHGEGHVVWSDNLISVTDAMNALREVPSAQPERKKGKWIPVTKIYKVTEDQFPKTHIEWVDATEPDEIDAVRCSECGEVFDFQDARNWCTECGTDMRTKETDCDYERAVEQLEHDMLYEPTFNQDDGSM